MYVKTHYCKLLDEQRYNIPETGTFLTNVTGNNLKKFSYPGHFLSEGNRVENKQETASIFNTFFSQIVGMI